MCSGKRYDLRKRRKAIDDMDTTIQTQIESIEEKSKQLAASQDLLKKTQVELQTMTGKITLPSWIC